MGDAEVPTLVDLVQAVTGKRVELVDEPGWLRITADAFEVGPASDDVALSEVIIHEVCHWIVAADWQREHGDNLGMGHSFDDYMDRDPRMTKRAEHSQERQACWLQRQLYRAAGVELRATPCGGTEQRLGLAGPGEESKATCRAASHLDLLLSMPGAPIGRLG